MRLGAEDIDLIRLMDWARTRPDIEPFILHVANERRTTPQAGKILKRKGVRSGVADIFLAKPSQNSHGLWIELKIGKGTRQRPSFLRILGKHPFPYRPLKAVVS